MLHSDFVTIQLHQNVGELALTRGDAAAAWMYRDPEGAAKNIENHLTFRNSFRAE